MSSLTTLVNNFDLIQSKKLEIMAYNPYKFSHLNFTMMRKGFSGRNSDVASIYDSNLGSYLMIWENFSNKWPGSSIIPLHIKGSPMSGHVSRFFGYDPSRRQVVNEKPERFYTGAMLHYVGRFRDLNPRKQMAVPIDQVVAELKENKPYSQRESYRLLTLRETFMKTLAITSGIESDGPSRMRYNLVQDRHYKPIVLVKAVLAIDLTHEERRRSAFSGSAVYASDLIREGKAKLRRLSQDCGFRCIELAQIAGNMAEVQFELRLPDNQTVLQTETMQHLTTFMHAVDKVCRRF